MAVCRGSGSGNAGYSGSGSPSVSEDEAGEDELVETLDLVGEVFNNEGEAGASSVLALLLPIRLLRAPLKVLILESIRWSILTTYL